jgi:hypothetical protein
MLSILKTVPHCGHFIRICSGEPAHPSKNNAKIDTVKSKQIHRRIIIASREEKTMT